MRGGKTPELTRLEFAAEYLRTLCIPAAAKAVGLPVSTAYDLARKLNEEADFVAARKSQRARMLEEAGDAALSLIRLGQERAHECAPVTTNIGAWSDIAAAYLKSVADLGRTVEKLSRLEAERAGEVTGHGDVVINIHGPETQPEPSDGPAKSG